MGSMVEVNDTLQLTTEQGFPADILDLAKHRAHPIKLEDVADRLFTFKDKPNARIFQLDPVRVFYYHNINGKWLGWGHVMIQSLTLRKNAKGLWVTDGTYKIVALYDPHYQEVFTRHETPSGQCYFDGPQGGKSSR